MLSTICRCMRSGLGRFLPLFLLIGCCLPLGCGRDKPQQPKDRLVSVKLTDETGAIEIECMNVQRGRFLAAIRAAKTKKDGTDSYEFLALDGDLLYIELGLVDKAGKPAGKISFPYIFRGDEKMPLAFSSPPGLVKLNGEVICVDLQSKAGTRWIMTQPAAKLKTVRTLLLSGHAATDTAALGRMVNSGITVVIKNRKTDSPTSSPTSKPAVKSIAKIEADVCEALIAARPVCIFMADKIEIGQHTIDQLSNLTHLVCNADNMPDLTKLQKLQFLAAEFQNSAALASLAQLPRLQGLYMLPSDNSHVDFAPLRKLKHLRTLQIAHGGRITNLDILSDMHDLRSLSMSLGPEVKSVAPIAKLTNLTELALMGIPPTVKDISSLKKLKNLKVLVVNDNYLEAHHKEFDEIRKALPECQIVGFCMGSIWILPLTLASIGLGVWWRRRFATRGAA